MEINNLAFSCKLVIISKASIIPVINNVLLTYALALPTGIRVQNYSLHIGNCYLILIAILTNFQPMHSPTIFMSFVGNHLGILKLPLYLNREYWLWRLYFKERLLSERKKEISVSCIWTLFLGLKFTSLSSVSGFCKRTQGNLSRTYSNDYHIKIYKWKYSTFKI